MSLGLPSTDWTWWGKFTAVLLLIGVTGAGLVFTIGPMFDMGWLGQPPSDKVSFYITGVGVPLLTFAGFLAVLLGFLAQQEQNTQQEEHFQKDRFESTFFQLLRTHNQIVEDVRTEKKESTDAKLTPPGMGDYETVIMSGRSCFRKFYTEFEELFGEKAKEKEWGDIESSKEGRVRWVYGKWFADRKSELNHYFSHLAKIISFIHRSDVGDKDFYIDLLTAQMSVPELKLFFYHVNLMKDDTEHRHLRDAYEVLGDYTFFEQIDRRSLAHDQHYQLNREALGMK